MKADATEMAKQIAKELMAEQQSFFKMKWRRCKMR